MKYSKLPYNPEKLNRELAPCYIPATEAELTAMLKEIGHNKLDDLYAHIPSNVKFEKAPQVCERLEYDKLITHMEELAKKNNVKTSFIGDGLKFYKVPEIVPFVSDIRGLSTAYTPYQPERSQGTLTTLWLYSSAMSMLTGFEAVNASMYDRSTCLYEAIMTGMRIVRGSDTALVLESIYPGDLEVLCSIATGTKITIKSIPYNKETGLTDLAKVREMIEANKGKLSSLAFPQVNSLGNLEDVNALTDLAHEYGLQAIAIVDPMLLATGGLKEPTKYGQKGANMIVAEGQHLAIGPNYGGPGLGIFAIRYNEQNKNDIRATAGRFVGRGKDANGNSALCMVLSTREQHIRREKANSNICSNESFIATLAGAGILERGEKGMTESCLKGRNNASRMASTLTKFEGVKLAYPQSVFFNEFVLEIANAKAVLEKARLAGLHLGVNISERTGNPNHILMTFTDVHGDKELGELVAFFQKNFKETGTPVTPKEVPTTLRRVEPVGLPNFSLESLKTFYTKLGEQNVSPDDNIYPLGSCTMKYNPYINDWAASLKGFTDVHPQAPEEDVQGSLEVLYGIQEMFKAITGLPGVALQPVAGAQGEFVGIKMFQAYFRDRGESETRNIIIIPKSAHGTNPATATVAGYETKVIDGVTYGLVLVNADEKGQVDFAQFSELVKTYNTRIVGIMVTNPNTSGIFETRFKEMADLIHSVGGLVYMDGANMNAIASRVSLGKLGVDASHNNLHKTWSISHGGGGPGDAIVAVSEKLIPFIPGPQVKYENGMYKLYRAPKSFGSVHRHHGNFAHKIRAYAYLKALGSEGVAKMSAVAVLSSRYLFEKLKKTYPTLPEGTENIERMHEFILTIKKEAFDRAEKAGTPKANAIARIGKLFLDFGLHAPTVAFPEVYGLMIEPTESYNKGELDRFAEVVNTMNHLINEHPEVLTTAPHFTPIYKVDEVDANKNLQFFEKIKELPEVLINKVEPARLNNMKVVDIAQEILKAHKARV